MGSAPDIPIGRVGRYDLLGRLAVGGMAEIFLARERMRGASRRAVVKFVRPDAGDEEAFREMFEREAQIAIRLAHPSICHVYEFNAVASRCYLAMELVEGQPLNDIIRRDRDRERVVPPVVYAAIFARVADGLSYAHELRDVDGRPLGIVHRDVSPHNIMVSYMGAVKLLDFGIAKVKAASAGVTTTGRGSLKGRFSYMSPEQSRAQPLDGRSDVFALGICLYEALTHQRLYDRSTPFATYEAIQKEPPPSVREHRETVDPELDAIVQRCLAKSPDDRWKNAGELQDALEGYLAYEREAVGSKRIARHMRELFEEEMREGPKLDRRREATGAFVVLDRATPRAATRAPRASAPAPAPEIADRVRTIAIDRRTWVIAAAVSVAVLAGATGGGGDAGVPDVKQAAAADRRAFTAIVHAAAPEPSDVVEQREPEPASPEAVAGTAEPVAEFPERSRTAQVTVSSTAAPLNPAEPEPEIASPDEPDPLEEELADAPPEPNPTLSGAEPASDPAEAPTRRRARVLRTPGF